MAHQPVMKVPCAFHTASIEQRQDVRLRRLKLSLTVILDAHLCGVARLRWVSDSEHKHPQTQKTVSQTSLNRRHCLRS